MSQANPVPDESQETDEEYIARMQVEVATLKAEAQALLAELRPAVRDITEIDQLTFYRLRLKRLIESDLWSPHTGTLRGELKVCALLVSMQFSNLRKQSDAASSTSPEQ